MANFGKCIISKPHKNSADEWFISSTSKSSMQQLVKVTFQVKLQQWASNKLFGVETLWAVLKNGPVILFTKWIQKKVKSISTFDFRILDSCYLWIDYGHIITNCLLSLI